jgi:hypothetical protein
MKLEVVTYVMMMMMTIMYSTLMYVEFYFLKLPVQVPIYIL